MAIAWALVIIEGKPEEVVLIVLPELENPDASVRDSCARLLSRAGAAGQPAIPILENMAKHDLDPHAAIAAKGALEDIRRAVRLVGKEKGKEVKECQ
jgi:hypothetical protein